VWSTLKQGGCLCLASKDNLTVHIGRTINQMQINVIDVTPSTALLITPGTVSCLRRMTVAGELINPALIPMWVNKVELLNAYGLSENTQVNWRREMVLGQNPQNIGRPSDTTTAFVLVPGTTKLSPLLIPGELCLGGNQLAVHYINRPEKTAEAFIQNPFGPGRLYRTGDMVIAHEDGSIEMVGRIDFQVKINGQRVEPGDSNTIIQTHAGIYTSSVVSADIDGQKVLVAVVVPKEEPNWPALRSELKELLKQHIPSYMMPAYWLWEKELPLNVNGKVDIPKLAKYVEGLGREHLLRFSSDHYHQPQTNGYTNGHTPGHVKGDSETPIAGKLTEDQATLREIWASVLSLPVERISPHDHFQSLGGTSLNAIRVSSQVNQSGLQVSVPDILRLSLSEITPRKKHVEIAEVSAGIAPFSLLPSNTTFSRDNAEDAFPTTSLQEGFLMDSLMGNSTYIYRRYYRIQGRQLSDILAALRQLASHHPVLRTTFVANKTSYLQVIRKTAQLSWQHLDMTPQEFSTRPKRTVELGGNFIHFAGLQGDVLAITVHHALLDYWSNSFFVDDLVATVLGQPLESRPSFANFIQYTLDQQKDGGLEKFWQGKLRDAAPSLLGGRAQENNVVRTQVNHNLPSFAAVNKVSVGSLIYAAWAVVLSLHTFQQDLVFGVTLSGRDVPVEGILKISGPTITTVPFRVQVDSEATVVELAKKIQDGMWDVSTRAQYGLRNILRASGQKTALYDTVVNVLVRENEPSSTDTYNILNPSPPYEPNYLDQTMLEAESVSGSLELRLLSSIPPQRASFILGNVVETLNAVLESPLKPIKETNPTSVEEEVFLDSLSLIKPAQSGQLAHSLLEQMAARYPDRLAVQDTTGRRLSYAEFQSAVNNLASYLRSRGVKTEDVIPLCLQKSVNTLISVFGVLKAGAAFTPLDPKNPPTRNEFIIRDVGACLAITDSHNTSIFASFSGEIINMDQIEATIRADTAKDFTIPGLGPDNLAYIIYTSGSTGLPKGVQVSHRAVAASTDGMIEACKVEKEWNVLWFLNYVFDASYFDVFTVLGVGGSISIADQDAMINDLAKYVNKFKVTQLMITPTISKLISPEDVPSLRALLVCGEPITPEVASVWATRMDVYNGYG
jgi:non-ribosomal peptide synthetase component F